MKQIKNFSSISDSVVAHIVGELNLTLSFKVLIVVNPNLDKEGDVCFAFAENMAFVNLKSDGDISTLAHELRHVWQMTQMGPQDYLSVYEEETLHMGYWQNVLEEDAFAWEEWYRTQFLAQAA